MRVDAGLEFRGIQFLIFGPVENFVFQVVFVDFSGVGEDPVVIGPEFVGVLIADAMGGFGGGLGPRVNGA